MPSLLSPGKHLTKLNIRRITISYHQSPDPIACMHITKDVKFQKMYDFMSISPFLPKHAWVKGKTFKVSFFTELETNYC